MTQTSGTKYAPGYDLFKLIVAVILAIILILLLLRESRGSFSQRDLINLTRVVPTETERVVPPTATPQPSPSPTSSPVETSTPAPLSTSTEPVAATPAPTELIPTESPSTEPIPTEPTPATDANQCPSNPTRIQAGATVRVLDWLNFRTSPGLNSPIQHTNRPGTEMEVIGGPVCTIRGKGDHPRAYLWWNVRMKDGREGWSAEAPLNYPNYFLEPIP